MLLRRLRLMRVERRLWESRLVRWVRQDKSEYFYKDEEDSVTRHNRCASSLSSSGSCRRQLSLLRDSPDF